MFIPYKRGTNLEIKLLKVRHMSRPNFSYIGLPNSVLKHAFLNVCGPLYESYIVDF
jgi:hypothetical protein